jgi:two-component system, NarL family, nitrate/nitrite sensor histidine kinase NarX
LRRGQNTVPRKHEDRTRRARGVPDVPQFAAATGADHEFENPVRPMLAAVVRMAGAAAGAIRLRADDSSKRRPSLAVGLPAGADAAAGGVFASWCRQCSESRDPDADCVRDRVCGNGESEGSELSRQLCRHVVVVPLGCRGVPVGTLELHFDDECALPTQTMPLLDAAGELIGAALENARLNRESLHASLTGERQMIANEVHDSLAQGLTYMRIRMSMLREAIKQGDELRAFKYCGDVDNSLTSAHARLRELITSFRTKMDPMGFQHALSEIARTFFDRTGIVLRFDNRAPDLHLPVGREVQAFHIVQEALANVCNHAKAGNVTVSLDRAGDTCEIVIEDDGVGVKATSANAERNETGHYGIAIMRERSLRLGGEFAIEPAAGTGTRVRVRFPVTQRQTERR